MKHLRLFESFNEYYWKVSKLESIKFFNPKELIDFTDRQIEIIKQHLRDGLGGIYINKK